MRVAAGGFEAEVDGVTMDGDVTTGLVGADVEGGRWLAGADVVSAFGRGTVESTLASVYPYARLRLNERVSAWGLAGYGTGALTLTEKSGTDAKEASSEGLCAGLRQGVFPRRRCHRVLPQHIVSVRNNRTQTRMAAP